MPELTANQATALDTELYELLFGVQRSVRYHYRRQRFLDQVNSCVCLLSALAGLGTVLSVLADFGVGWVTALAAMTAVSGAFELVVGTARAASQHNNLGQKWISLEQDILKVRDNVSIRRLRSLQVQRLEIETKEPPPLKVLDAMCHNELIRALGHDESELVEIGTLQRLVAHLFDLGEDSLLAPAWRASHLT